MPLGRDCVLPARFCVKMLWMEKVYSDFQCVLRSESDKAGCPSGGLLFGKELLLQGPPCVLGYPGAASIFLGGIFPSGVGAWPLPTHLQGRRVNGILCLKTGRPRQNEGPVHTPF